MKQLLPHNFELHRYGLVCRLVDESDAEFIFSLRRDPIKSQFISATNGTVNDQIEWIRDYKKRERNGVDYYFIYLFNGERIGVNRIYNIDSNSFIHGSWIFINNIPPYCSLAAAVIAREIAFYSLCLGQEVDTAGIHENNKGVLNFASFMGEEFTGYRETEQGRFITGILSKEKFEQNIEKIKQLFPHKVL